jgi:mono/diheme cytochrome c family protein
VRLSGHSPLAALVAVSTALMAAGCGREHEADLVNGKTLFVQKCASCHTLNRANARGVVGPNLDEAFQVALREGMTPTTVEGVVRRQIANVRRSSQMPRNLVEGNDARDVAAYVAAVAGRSGKDTGLLASAVQAAGGGTAVEKDGVLTIPADPNGQLAYTASKATGTPGPVTITMPNKSGVDHDIQIDGLGKGPVVKSGDSSFKATLEAGKSYTYYCGVPGHRQAGMQGTLTVK